MPTVPTPLLRPLQCLRLLPTALLLASTLALVGCGKTGSGGGPTDVLKGKVTLNNQPVRGTVVFIGTDKKENSCPIAANGEYVIPNPAKGEGVILVKGALAGTQAPVGKIKDAAKDSKVEATQLSGVDPPEKYSKPEHGVKVTITSGEQVKDLILEP